MIERLDAGEPPSSPEEAQARAPYERLLARIRDLDDIAPPAGWEDRAVARWSGARRKRRFAIALGTATAAAAVAAVFLLQPCAAPTATGLEVAVSRPPGSTRRGDAAVGDSLRASARSDQPHVELRVYLETRLVARCPGCPSCRRDGSALKLDWKLGEAGRYQIILLSSSSDIPAGDGILDRDLLNAQGAGIDIEKHPPFTVTP
jgi:hypothetical protein